MQIYSEIKMPCISTLLPKIVGNNLSKKKFFVVLQIFILYTYTVTRREKENKIKYIFKYSVLGHWVPPKPNNPMEPTLRGLYDKLVRRLALQPTCHTTSGKLLFFF